MLQAGEFLIGLEYEPSERANPERRAAIEGVTGELEAAGVSLRGHLHFRSGAVLASVGTLGPYIVPAAQIIIPTLGAILVAWVRAPKRKIRIRIGDTVIEATSVEDVERLMALLENLKAEETGKKKKP